MEINFCYNGNIKLKKAGVKQSFTWDEVGEMTKCRFDIHYFTRTYCMITSLDDGLVNFNLYDYQNEMVDIMHKNRFSIFLCPRQMGKTQTVGAYLLHQAIFNEGFGIAVVAHKADGAREIIARMQAMYEELPWFMQPGIRYWNKGSFQLGNKTRVFSGATTGSSVRGKSINIVYLDEFAFVENDLEFYTSTYPVITSGTTTKVIISSTPNGMNLFYKMWTDAVEGRSSYVPMRVYWHQHPHRDAAWKAEQLANMSSTQFAQEFDCMFLGSAGTLISGDRLEKLAFKDPIQSNAHLFIQEHPIPGKSYVATVDTAEGVGRDYSAISVIDVSSIPYRQVAVYRNNLILPLQFAEVAYSLATRYNEALLLIEANSVGSIVCNSVWYDYEYENMLTTKVKNQENVVSGSGKITLGIRTTARTKPIGCSSLKALIEGETLLLEDYNTISELSCFITKGKSYAAEKGKTDDIVMTLVMFGWFTTQDYFVEMTDVNVRQAIRANLDAQNSFDLLGFIDNGVDVYEEPHGLF